jgi:hypothetical protein
MKSLLILVFMIVSVGTQAQEPANSYTYIDGGYACLKPSKVGALKSQYQALNAGYEFGFESAEFAYTSTKVRCESMSSIRNKIEGVTVLLSVSSAVLACTAVGAPVAAQIAVAAAGSTALHFVLGQIPCEDKSDEKINQMVKERTCEVLETNGIACDPNRVPLKVYNL